MAAGGWVFLVPKPTVSELMVLMVNQLVRWCYGDAQKVAVEIASVLPLDKSFEEDLVKQENPKDPQKEMEPLCNELDYYKYLFLLLQVECN